MSSKLRDQNMFQNVENGVAKLGHVNGIDSSLPFLKPFADNTSLPHHSPAGSRPAASFVDRLFLAKFYTNNSPYARLHTFN